jgi:hypothetical protein
LLEEPTCSLKFADMKKNAFPKKSAAIRNPPSFPSLSEDELETIKDKEIEDGRRTLVKHFNEAFPVEVKLGTDAGVIFELDLTVGGGMRLYADRESGISSFKILVYKPDAFLLGLKLLPIPRKAEKRRKNIATPNSQKDYDVEASVLFGKDGNHWKYRIAVVKDPVSDGMVLIAKSVHREHYKEFCIRMCEKVAFSIGSRILMHQSDDLLAEFGKVADLL